MPLATALLLYSAEVWLARTFSQGIPAKGSIARYTIRAERDAVFDLHQTRKAEAEEAKQSYIPIYNKDKQLLQSVRLKIEEAALASALESWPWPELGAASPEVSANDGGPPDSDLGALELMRPSGFSYRDELSALLAGCFRLLEPYFAAGVIADSEFPKEKNKIRVFVDGRYHMVSVSKLHRFSKLRAVLSRGAKAFFFKSAPRLRQAVVDFVLQRLPANVFYAKANERFVADISQITGLKVVLIRRGEVLVGRGQVVDSRAHEAIRAAEIAASAPRSSWTGRYAGRCGLIAALLLMFVLAGQTICPAAFRGLKAYAFVHLAFLALAVLGKLALLYWPIHAALLPQAAIALTLAVVVGKEPAVLAAIAVGAGMGLSFHFDIAAIVVGTGGGTVAALATPRRRRSGRFAHRHHRRRCAGACLRSCTCRGWPCFNLHRALVRCAGFRWRIARWRRCIAHVAIFSALGGSSVSRKATGLERFRPSTDEALSGAFA